MFEYNFHNRYKVTDDRKCQTLLLLKYHNLCSVIKSEIVNVLTTKKACKKFKKYS